MEKSFQKFEHLPFEFSVNISYEDIESPDFLDFIKELLKKYDSNDDYMNIYKIGNAKEIEMEFYDATAHKLLEDESYTVTKK